MNQDTEEATFVPAYRVRVRLFSTLFIKGKGAPVSLDLKHHVAELTVDPEEYTKGQASEVKINVWGIPKEDEALSIGSSLRKAISVMAVLRRMGVDLGEDVPTASLAQSVREKIESSGDQDIRNNMHGVDVFYEKRPTTYFGISASGYSSIAATRIAEEIKQVFHWIEDVPPKLLEVANLLNAADNTPAEEARIALTMAAIEALAPEVDWSVKQRDVIVAFHAKVLADSKLEHELEPVASTLNGILSGPGIGTGLRMMLNDLEMPELWPELRELRKVRGKLMHGESVKKSERIDVADRTRVLAGQLFAATLKKQGLPDRAMP